MYSELSSHLNCCCCCRYCCCCCFYFHPIISLSLCIGVINTSLYNIALHSAIIAANNCQVEFYGPSILENKVFSTQRMSWKESCFNLKLLYSKSNLVKHKNIKYLCLLLMGVFLNHIVWVTAPLTLCRWCLLDMLSIDLNSYNNHAPRKLWKKIFRNKENHCLFSMFKTIDQQFIHSAY